MRIALARIDDVPRESRFSETLDLVREDVSAGVRFPSPIQVNVTCYRSGRDIFFRGGLRGEAEGDTCCYSDMLLW